MVYMSFDDAAGISPGEVSPYGVLSLVAAFVRVSVLILFAAALPGCSDDAEIPAPTAAVPDDQSTVTSMYGVSAQVSYPGEKDSLSASSQVYVFLRKPGSRMPIAVQHFAASELPRRVNFSGPAQEESLELVVRLSPQGRVDRSSEDIEITQRVEGFRHPPQTYAMVLEPSDRGTVQTSAHPSGAAANTAMNTAVDVDSNGRPDVPVSINASVSIDSSHQFRLDTVVFVVARKPGQVMPTVVKRLSLAELPARIELTDADAMTLTDRLSDAVRLDLFARVSTSGNAAPSSSDWVSPTVRVEIGNVPELVDLKISPPAAL